MCRMLRSRPLSISDPRITSHDGSMGFARARRLGLAASVRGASQLTGLSVRTMRALEDAPAQSTMQSGARRGQQNLTDNYPTAANERPADSPRLLIAGKPDFAPSSTHTRLNLPKIQLSVSNHFQAVEFDGRGEREENLAANGRKPHVQPVVNCYFLSTKK